MKCVTWIRSHKKILGHHAETLEITSISLPCSGKPKIIILLMEIFLFCVILIMTHNDTTTKLLTDSNW